VLCCGAGAFLPSPSRLAPLRASGELGARFGRCLQQSQQHRIEALGYLVVVASLITHAGKHSMAVSVFHKIKPKIGRRPLNADLHRLWRRHAHQVGEVITAWNDLQAGFFLIFQTLSETKNPKSSAIALAIWHSIQSDSAQREMMLSVARAALPENSRAYSQIKWLKDRADKLTPFRNDPAHTPIAFMRTDEHGNIAVSPNVFVSNTDLRKYLDRSVSFISGHGSIAGTARAPL
jgi:hypothetical protein